MLKAVRKTRIPEEIVAQVHNLVLDGQLNPGDRLPPERELAQQLSVSRASVREAMRLLDTNGLVDVRPGAGTFIATGTLEAIDKAFSSVLSNRGSNPRDLFEMRLLLEPHVASLAAQRATEQDVYAFNRVLAAQADDIAAGGSGVEFDLEFHFAIARATGNSALLAVTQAISDILLRSREPSLQSSERSRLSLQSHREILDSIRSGSPQQAEQTMHRHIAEIDKEVHDLSPVAAEVSSK